jgi:hypothetical protein
MVRWVRELDRILRGEATRPSALHAGRIEFDLRGLVIVLGVLGALYGCCMGWFAVFNRESPEFRQVVSSTVKVPALFFLTLLITLPSLYVFNALVGSRLTVPALVRLLLAALGVTLAALASFGPVVAFFSLTTTNYPFMLLLNVVLFAVSGALEMVFLLQTLHRLTLNTQGQVPAELAAPEPAGALEQTEGHVLGRNVKTVFRCWVVLFMVVGAQMSWVLRPFLGHPGQPFESFRGRESNFFEAVARTVVQLFS